MGYSQIKERQRERYCRVLQEHCINGVTLKILAVREGVSYTRMRQIHQAAIENVVRGYISMPSGYDYKSNKDITEHAFLHAVYQDANNKGIPYSVKDRYAFEDEMRKRYNDNIWAYIESIKTPKVRIRVAR